MINFGPSNNGFLHQEFAPGTPEGIKEEVRIRRLEEMDKENYVKDIVDLVDRFQNHGISRDTAAILAGQFFNDPDLKNKRRKRREKK